MNIGEEGGQCKPMKDCSDKFARSGDAFTCHWMGIVDDIMRGIIIRRALGQDPTLISDSGHYAAVLKSNFSFFDYDFYLILAFLGSK